MSTDTATSLSRRRIVNSLLIFAAIPVLRTLLNRLTGSDTVALTFAFNAAAWALVLYDWELIALHWNRFKSRRGDGLIYTIIGLALLGAWFWVNQSFLHGYVLLPDAGELSRYSFAWPAIMAAFTYCQAAVINILFKCLTDHFDAVNHELAMILLSGFLCGALYTVTLTPVSYAYLVPTYLFNIVTVGILSYLYNQSHTFIPGILALGTVLLAAVLLG